MYKIVQMVPALGWGGAQVFCIQLCNELAKYDGYDVTLVSMYHHVPDKHLPLSMLNEKVKFITLGKKPGMDFTMFFKIKKLLKKLKPDVVHTHLHSGYYCFLAYTTIKDYYYRKIHTFHNLAKQDAPIHGRIAYKYFFGKGIIHPVTISDEVHKSAVLEYGNSIKTLIYNGSDPVSPTAQIQQVKDKLASLKKNVDTKIFLNVARITKQKNQLLLFKCMKALQDEGANAIAVILGDYLPDDKPIYDELMKEQPSNVFMLGKVTNVGDYLLESDAFVLSSIFEGMPISILEALSAGSTPVCTPVGGLINIVTKDIGFLSSEVSYESYLKALKTFINTPYADLSKMKENGKALYLSDFSMVSCAAKYNELYHSKN